MKTLLSLEDILAQWAEDAKFDENNLDSETIKTSRLHAKYLEMFSLYKLQLRKNKVKGDIIKKDKQLYYSGKMSKAEMDKRDWDYDPFSGCSKPLKSDLDNWYNADPDLIKLNDKLEYIKVIIETLDDIIQTLRWRHTHVKNVLEWKKFINGN
jgi:hypothetical protein